MYVDVSPKVGLMDICQYFNCCLVSELLHFGGMLHFLSLGDR